MWFNPSELSKTKTTYSANSANPANSEPESRKEDILISKLAGLAEAFISETATQSHKVAGIAAPDNQKFVNCGKCLYFKCHNSHGNGAGQCSIGDNTYTRWSETQNQCTKFNAAVEWVELPDINPGGLVVTGYTPNGKPMKVQATRF